MDRLIALEGHKDVLFYRSLVIGLFLLACWLRLYCLNGWGLWGDELFSADLILNRPLIPPAGTPWLERLSLFNVGLDASFWTIKAADQSPPLFELAGKLVTAVLGDGEIALRLTSALASVILLAWLGLRAWRQRTGPFRMVYLGLFLLTALSGLQISYAQEARAYALGTLFTGIAVVLFWERIIAGWHRALLPGWGEVALYMAACWTHYDALLLTGLLMMPYAWEASRRKDWAALARMSTVAVVVVLWLALSYPAFRFAAHGGMGWVPRMPFGETLQLVFKDFFQLALEYPLAILMAVLLLTAIFWGARKPIPGTKLSSRGQDVLQSGLRGMTLVWLAYMLLASWVVQKSHIMHVRHLIFILPAVYLMAGISLALLWLRWRWAGWVALIAMALLQWPLIEFYNQLDKTDLRDASAFVTQRLHDGDVVMVFPTLDTEGVYGYYLIRRSHKALQLHVIHDKDARQMCSQIDSLPRFGLMGDGAQLSFADALVKNCGAAWQIERTIVPNAFGQVWEHLSLDLEKAQRG